MCKNKNHQLRQPHTELKIQQVQAGTAQQTPATNNAEKEMN